MSKNKVPTTPVIGTSKLLVQWECLELDQDSELKPQCQSVSKFVLTYCIKAALPAC